MTTLRPVVGQPHPISEITLLPSRGGRFEVTVDGDLIYSKAATGRHADPAVLIEEIRTRLRK